MLTELRRASAMRCPISRWSGVSQCSAWCSISRRAASQPIAISALIRALPPCRATGRNPPKHSHQRAFLTARSRFGFASLRQAVCLSHRYPRVRTLNRPNRQPLSLAGAPVRPRVDAKLDAGRFVDRDTHSRIPLGRHRPDLWRTAAVSWRLVTRALGSYRHHLSGPKREWVAFQPGSVVRDRSLMLAPI